MKKHPTPVLTAEQVPYNQDKPRSCVFNAGVAKIDGEYLMVFRNDYEYLKRTLFSGTNLGIARSQDGINWSVDPEPIITADIIREQWAHIFPERFMPSEIRRVYDPRITVFDGKIILCLAMDTPHGVVGAIASTTDWKNYECLSISTPDNRNMVLFPEKVNGQFLRLERPFPIYGRGKPEAFEIWSSKSNDLRYWGDTRLVLASEEVPYSNSKIGPAAPPIKTEKGWLCTIHAVEKVEEELNSWHDNWKKIYHGGLILLDLEDPTKVIGLAKEPLIRPELKHEIEGFRGSVIFPCGMILEDNNEVKIYYGSADTCVGLVTASLEELLDTIEPIN
ncbi:glycoside hydrolase family 130 protein [Coraliomargarita sp. SDUM461003]|uniref:Glycoside hydrolase family 130 protein n=1 Tax=Thalassobacterium maritimum TaxID=3041265 RepID=A0ABU1AYM8_9BACT|nr:glycoside hydrolase family 130 protein [Coraliomargarita sp. SDUM461003]MDQ8209258.1 glycoside hydrolase family 130 protein [Coraliomargarita sp. SDUM461003]